MSTSILTKFTFSSDLATAKEEIKKYIKRLNDIVEKPTGSLRISQVSDLIEAYVEATGQRPDPYQLYALGSYILDDYLTDQYKHLRGDEFPFKTDGRMKKNHARNKTIFLGDRTDVSTDRR
jgi:hypothetical protein